MALLGGAAAFLLAYLLCAVVLRENAYLSRTVEVHKGQKVIDTGLYGVVRRPMYSAMLILFLSTPLVLASLVTLAVFLVYLIFSVKRISKEETVLEQDLVKYRLIPFVW